MCYITKNKDSLKIRLYFFRKSIVLDDSSCSISVTLREIKTAAQEQQNTNYI